MQIYTHTPSYTRIHFPYFPHGLWKILQGVPSLQKFKQSHFRIKRCNYTPLGFLEPGELSVHACSSVFHHVCKSIIVSWEQRGSRQQVGAGLSAPMAEHSLYLCLLTSAHVRGREKDNESRVAIATLRKVTPPPPNVAETGGAFFIFFFLSIFLCACLNMWGHWYSVNLEPWEDPPPSSTNPSPLPLPLPADRRIDCSCSASLSSVCVLWGDHQWAGPGVFHPQPESSTLPLHRMKGEPLRILPRGGQTGNTVTFSLPD